MRRKSPITLNLPPKIKELGTAYAEATGRSFSVLLEDLIKAQLKEAGVSIEPTPEEIRASMESQASKPKRVSKKKGANGSESR